MSNIFRYRYEIGCCRPSYSKYIYICISIFFFFCSLCVFYESTCNLLRNLKALHYLNQKSRGGSLRIVTVLLAGQPKNRNSFPGSSKKGFSFRNIHSGCGIHKASSAVGTGDFPPEEKRLRPLADLSPPSSPECPESTTTSSHPNLLRRAVQLSRRTA